MTQTSGPISQGTIAERQFTDVLWRDLFGGEPGVIGDLDGTAYAITLPPDSDTAAIGSSTQNSLSMVAGFVHKIPAGAAEGVTIPAANAVARTDLIVVRYDPANTGAPGPCRLVRIEGTNSGQPAYDAAPPGVEDLPLWAVTRQPGQALSQAAVKRVFPRLAPVLNLPDGAPLPTSSPLGTVLQQGRVTYRRELDSSQVPVWVQDQYVQATAPASAPDGALWFQVT